MKFFDFTQRDENRRVVNENKRAGRFEYKVLITKNKLINCKPKFLITKIEIKP
ncbi:unnamed protein product [marine sediment metagenome]|uniref:Uncharacterized protein n=1 Tax=marine sediment metagenome TaxID=412755 RepID=X1J6B3_9ZZZZ